jgi:hypothetical protein
MPKDVKEAIFVAADSVPYPGHVGEAISAYAEQGHRDMALHVFNAHAVLTLTALVYQDAAARVMTEGLDTEGWTP